MTESTPLLPARGHVHLDAVGGVAGDMFVAALLDALPALRPRVFEDLAAVLPDFVGKPELSEGLSGGMAVRRFGLVTGQAGAIRMQGHDGHAHEHGHAPGGGPGQGGSEGGHGHGTRFVDLAARIEAAALHPGTASHSVRILRRLAEAESRMHRVPIDEVHFHEVGDWDSLLDVVAAGSIAATLAGWTWSVSELPRGGGLVRTRHGLLPVPAPATAELLTGFRWRDDGHPGERVTPTGAAILAHLIAAPSMPLPAGLRLIAAGMGAGTRELEGMPNVLRALVHAVDADAAVSDDEVMVLSFDIDDMSGEEIGVAADRLREADGVLDVSMGLRLGKKGRPLHEFRLLVVPAQLDAISALCLRETSTIGLRWQSVQRRRLARSSDAVALGDVTLRRKQVQRPGGETTVKVESDDLARTPTLAARRRLQSHAERAEHDKGEPS
jgi:pyridinium-3,5-bisthiocarboxylic acid mononucleotide nickel chelatase